MAGAVATLLVIVIIASIGDFRLARVQTVDVYVTAVDAQQSSIGYAKSPDGDVLGTYDLRGLDVWSDGANGGWIPVDASAQNGRPTCIPPGSYGARVRLTFVRSVLAGSSVVDHVARLRCLSPPTG